MLLSGRSLKVRVNTVVLEAELENYTPLIAGGWDDSKVFIELGGVKYPVALNLAKALIGKSRWLLRLLIISGCLAGSLPQAEEWPGIEVRVNDQGRRLGLVELLFGSSTKGWRGLYSVKMTPLNPGSCRGDKYFDKNRTLTRYNLITMGMKAGKLAKLPIEPGCSFKLVIERRPLNASIGTSLALLDSLAAGTAITVIRLIGLGQGSTRGFGRFVIKKIEKKAGNIPGNKIDKIIEYAGELDSVESGEKAKKIIREMIEELKRVIRDAGTLPRTESLASNNGSGATAPILDLDNVHVGRANLELAQRIVRNLPGGKKYYANLSQRGKLYAALEVIAMATLKASWKSLNGQPRRGGGHYHTWILGLPRKQKQGAICCSKHKGVGELPTGYIVRLEGDSGGGRKEKVSIVSQDPHQAYMIASRAAEGSKVTHYEDGRRASPFILFPVNAPGSLVAVIPIKPYDMKALIDDCRLLHVGGFQNPRCNRGKPGFMDQVRIACVKDIATKGVPRIQDKCKSYPFVNDCVVGVARPGGSLGPCRSGSVPSNLAVPADKLLDEAYNAALEFIKRFI